MQHLGMAKSLEEKVASFFSKILPKFNSRELNPNDFPDEANVALLQTFYHELNKHEPDFKDCGEYKLLRFPDNTVDRLGISLKAFIEMIAANPDAETLTGVEVVCGCWYRKEHKNPDGTLKVLTDHEIIETAFHFRKQPLSYALSALKCMDDLVKDLRNTYQTLYGDADESDTAENTRMTSMINALSNKDVTKWDDVYMLAVKVAFMFLEASEIERIKEINKNNLHS